MTTTTWLETQRTRRGHDFIPAEAAHWPKADETESVPIDEKIFVAHYFVTQCDWYIVEYDHESGYAFGWAELVPGGGEWGSFNLHEIEQIRPFGWLVVERDCFFEPAPARDILAARR